jgi:hypothetical protein
MNLFHGGGDQFGTCRNAHPKEMVRTVATMIGTAGLLFASATAGANTLNIRIQPHLQVNTPLHVDVKPRLYDVKPGLYRDAVFAESCVGHPKRNDQGSNASKRCRLDD